MAQRFHIQIKKNGISDNLLDTIADILNSRKQRVAFDR